MQNYFFWNFCDQLLLVELERTSNTIECIGLVRVVVKFWTKFSKRGTLLLLDSQACATTGTTTTK